MLQKRRPSKAVASLGLWTGLRRGLRIGDRIPITRFHHSSLAQNTRSGRAVAFLWTFIFIVNLSLLTVNNIDFVHDAHASKRGLEKLVSRICFQMETQTCSHLEF